MTIVRLGYVSMSVNIKNCSPSQTMTYTRFKKIEDRDVAIQKLEKIARSNIENCLRLLKHNLAHDVHFFRLSSRLIPLATHEDLKGWNYIKSVKEKLTEVKTFLKKHNMRVDFHPDHFVLLNSNKVEVLNNSIKTLGMHERLLRGMGIEAKHRCVLHVGGGYNNKEKALEQFISNWGFVPKRLQDLVILENDDKTFNIEDTLYLCEKLGIPMVFDYHHHLANHMSVEWEKQWGRIKDTWKESDLPIKMHISSPKNEKEFRHHNDFVDPQMFLEFLHGIKDYTTEIDCMIEAKKKDEALFQLMDDLSKYEEIELIDQASFKVH